MAAKRKPDSRFDLPSVIRGLIERLIEDDWIRFRSADGADVYYVIGADAWGREVEQGRSANMEIRASSKVSILGEHLVRAAIAAAASDKYVKRAGERLEKSGITVEQVTTFLAHPRGGNDRTQDSIFPPSSGNGLDAIIGHRCGFRRYWTWKSRRRRLGRPGVAPEIRELIRNMSRANPLWGAPRVHGELAKLGISISQAAVSKYMVRHRTPPSHTWRSFLDNHAKDLVSLDFFTLPTATFRVLFVFIVLRHERRRIVHFNVTEHPSAEWTAQQMVDAFPWDTAPRYLVRDRDQTYGAYFDSRVDGLGIEQVLTAPRSPWQNPFVERMIGSIRRECLDHVIVLDERHLKRILRKYVDYYHSCRTHLSLEKDAQQALHERRLNPEDPLVHHSDRGVQYVSTRYTEPILGVYVLLYHLVRYAS